MNIDVLCCKARQCFGPLETKDSCLNRAFSLHKRSFLERASSSERSCAQSTTLAAIRRGASDLTVNYESMLRIYREVNRNRALGLESTRCNASKAGDQEPWGWVNDLIQISHLPCDITTATVPSCTNNTKTNFSAAVKMQFRNQLSQKAAQKKRRSRRRDTKRAQDCSMLHEKWQTINKFLFPFAEPICSQNNQAGSWWMWENVNGAGWQKIFVSSFFFNENFYAIEFRGFCHFALHSSLSAPFQDFNLIEKNWIEEL